MVLTARCPECDARMGRARGPDTPCERCIRAWKWLAEHQTEKLREGWAAAVAEVERNFPDAEESKLLRSIRIVSWENRVVTLAAFKRERRWAERRYAEPIRRVVRSEKSPVFVDPRAGATIARRIQREKEE